MISNEYAHFFIDFIDVDEVFNVKGKNVNYIFYFSGNF